MDSLATARTTISHLFSDGTFTNPAEFLAKLEESTGWYFVMDRSGNMSKFETWKQLNGFVAMAIADIRSTHSGPDVRARFRKLYRLSFKTLLAIEDDFSELSECSISAPVGNPRHWRLMFDENSERICELLARDQTNYCKLILPDTQHDLTKAGRKATEYASRSPLAEFPDGNLDTRLLYAAFAYMHTYLGVYHDRWMKFFGYLRAEKKVELLSFWYPDY